MKTFTKILCVILISFACISPINTPTLAGRSWGKVSKSMDQTVLSVLSYLPPHTLNQSCLVWLLRRDTAINKAVFLTLMVSQIVPETAMLQNSQGVPLSSALTTQPENCVWVLLTSNLMGTLWWWLNSHVKYSSWLFGAEGVMEAAKLPGQVLYREKCQSHVMSPTFWPHASHFAKLSLLSWISFFTIISFWNEKWMSGVAQIVT